MMREIKVERLIKKEAEIKNWKILSLSILQKNEKAFLKENTKDAAKWNFDKENDLFDFTASQLDRDLPQDEWYPESHQRLI